MASEGPENLCPETDKKARAGISSDLAAGSRKDVRWYEQSVGSQPLWLLRRPRKARLNRFLALRLGTQPRADCTPVWRANRRHRCSRKPSRMRLMVKTMGTR